METVATETHNRIAMEVFKQITEPLTSGGRFTDVLVILESVMVGVIFAGVKMGGDEAVLDEVVLHVKERMAAIRLRGAMPEGSA